MRRVTRGGEYFRVADPSWADPLDASYAGNAGGRWNPPGSFPIVYLNATREVAKANVEGRLVGSSINPEDLDPAEGPELVVTNVPSGAYVDAITDEGCVGLGLPPTYPRESDGNIVPHSTCRPIGQDAWDSDEIGIACRSAAPSADGEELAWFFRTEALQVETRIPFDDWYWAANA
ncbi:MAG: RES domain-containing protein [Actinomycetota bacterium]